MRDKEKNKPWLCGRKTLLFAIFVSLIFGILGASVWFNYYYLPKHDALLSANGRSLRLGTAGLTDPLLDYAVPKDADILLPLDKKLQATVNSETENGSASDVAVYFRDLNLGRWTGVNETDKFSPASLLKVPLMISYFKLAETDPGILTQEVNYNGSFDDNAIEDIKPLKSIEVGQSYTIDELIKFMIGYSDNNATHLLADNIDQKIFNSVFTDLGMPIPTGQADSITPQQYSLFFRILYNATYLNTALSQKATKLLADYQDFPQGLSAGLPVNVVAAQKFGEHSFSDGSKELHDCGVIYHVSRPYFLCVMTKGNDFIKLTNIIRDISVLVYKEVDSNYGSSK